MKKRYLSIIISLMLVSCAPVISRDLLNQGIFSMSPSEIKQDPAANKGRLFIFGGIIVKTEATKEGSLIEAIFVPVNSMGYLKNYKASNGRFLAIYRGKDLLDPLIFSEKREITLAGEFIEMRRGNIGEMEYAYPLFEIKEIFLWDEAEKIDYYYYPPPHYYPPWYYRHRIYDPWWYY